MIYLTGYTFSFVLGWLLNRLLLYRSIHINPLYRALLSFGLGIGLSVHLTGYIFLIFGEYNRTVLWIAHSLIFVLLIILNLRLQPHKKGSHSLDTTTSVQINFFLIFRLFVLVLLGILITQIAYLRPYGEWDGWAVWNQKLRFLILGGREWTNLFTVHPTARPDYPLFLPLWNTWAWSATQANLSTIPLISGIMFCLLTLGLLWDSLLLWTRPLTASCGFGILASFSPFLYFATSQYSDIVVAFYLLASITTILLSIREQDPGFGILAGLFLGFLCFIKNEGPVLAGLLLGCSTAYLCTVKSVEQKIKMPLLIWWLAGITITLPITIIFKYYLAPPAPDVMRGLLSQPLPYFNVVGLNLIIGHIIATIASPPYLYIGGLLGLMFILAPHCYLEAETKILSSFLFLYFIVLTGVYLTTVDYDLTWRLSRTFFRILMYQTPAIIFLHFYAYWHKGTLKNP